MGRGQCGAEEGGADDADHVVVLAPFLSWAGGKDQGRTRRARGKDKEEAGGGAAAAARRWRALRARGSVVCRSDSGSRGLVARRAGCMTSEGKLIGSGTPGGGVLRISVVFGGASPHREGGGRPQFEVSAATGRSAREGCSRPLGAESLPELAAGQPLMTTTRDSVGESVDVCETSGVRSLGFLRPNQETDGRR
jgi:hypothetical protein